MRTAAQALLGEHDFRHFCKADVLQVRGAHINFFIYLFLFLLLFDIYYLFLLFFYFSSCGRADTWVHSLRVWAADWAAFWVVGLGWMGVGNGVMHVSWAL
jgi:hypothetical protein